MSSSSPPPHPTTPHPTTPVKCEKQENTTVPPAPKKKKKKKKNHRCKVCRIKLTMVEKHTPCRCGKHFCKQHRYADEHNCTFDYRAFQTKLLNKALVERKIVNQQYEKLI